MKRSVKFILALTFVGITTGYRCFAQEAKQKFSIPSELFAERIHKTPDAIILDVRTQEEVKGGYIEGAQHMDYRSKAFKAEVAKLDKGKPYYVYCLSGGRSGEAAKYMRSIGFEEVYDMKGGLLSWQKNNLPITTKADHKRLDKISREVYNTMVSSDTLVLVDFYAPWCAPCKKMEPILKELAAENMGMVKLIRLNVDENKDLAKQLGVVEIPVVKYYRSGKEYWTHTGFADKTMLQEAMQAIHK
ncbi:MAG TPA: thioredoxin domain-containing protein [Ohtaekwangia sp.]|nr:thioredoxin domain-containing protein [Ohtaekwangia sp.]